MPIPLKAQVSLRSYERYAEVARKNLVPLLGAVILTKLQPAQISAAYSTALSSGRIGRGRGGGLSTRTVRYMHAVLKQALRQAVKWNHLKVNPADAVDPPKVERKAMQTYDLSQTVELIEHMRPTRMHVPTVLAVLCGLRRGEIAALRWRNVDLASDQLAVVESAEQSKKGVRYKEPKAGRGRNVALSPTVIEELQAWRLQQAQELLRLGVRPGGDTFVVTQVDGNPLRPDTLSMSGFVCWL